MSLSLPEAMRPLREWLAENQPGAIPLKLVILTANGVMDMPLPPAVPSQVGPPQAITMPAVPPTMPQQPATLAFPDEEEEEEDIPFIPGPFQKSILKALNGKALRTDQLGAAVGDKSRLYKTHGLQELRNRGLVKHHPSLGFYRPDAPPPELANTEGGEGEEGGED